MRAQKVKGTGWLLGARVGERLPDGLNHCRRTQRLREDQKIVSLVWFADYRDFSPPDSFSLLTSDQAFYKGCAFRQPAVAAFGHETVVMLGRQFDEYFHGGKLFLRTQEVKNPSRRSSQNVRFLTATNMSDR